MVAKGFEIVTQGDVESPLQSSQQQPKNQTFQSLGRQSSIYSLTLDEFQQTLCEGGKKFGSMNMDEFLNSICTAEENQAQQHAEASAIDKSKGTYVGQFPQKECGIIDKGISKQPSITRQDSLSVPETFCRKTADEVWSEIHKNQQHNNDSYTHTENPNATQSQPTFGDMTLEDFLVQVGVTRAQNLDTQPPEQPPYGMHQNNHHHAIGLNFVSRPIMAIGGSTSCGVNLATYQAHPQSGVGEAPSYPGGIKTGGAYSQQAAVSDGGRVANGNEGLGQVHGLRTLSPASPVFSGGLRVNQVDGGNRLELDIGRTGAGQKQIVDGQVDKEVARRQRRMIKNRESAARSRARKQAYTVELEAELDQLKEENARLKLALAEFERRRKQQYYQEAGLEVQMHSKAPKANEKSRVIRRSSSCPY